MDMSACPPVSTQSGHVRPLRSPLGADSRTDEPDIEPPDERLAAAKARLAKRRADRAEFAQRRAHGIAARHANKIQHLRTAQP